MKEIKPISIKNVDLSNDEVEVIVPAGYVLVQAMSDAGGELEQPFLTKQSTWDKVYSKQSWPNSKPKFSIKKKQ